MHLEKNEYTYASFIQFLSKKFGTKITGKEFNPSDVCQYLRRGYLPWRYGGNNITSNFVNGITIITLHETKDRKAELPSKNKPKSKTSKIK